MAAFFLLLLLLFTLCPASTEAQQKYSNISLGSSLTPHSNPSSWFSPSRLYAFGFISQDNGLAVGIYLAGTPGNITVVWTANRDDHPVLPRNNVTLSLTIDGRFIIQQTQAGDDISIANPPVSIASASMLDTGNFVLYGHDQTIIWQSFENPTDTLLPGQRLVAEKELYSRASATDYSRGIFGLYMQGDGNLVQYPVDGRAVQNAFFSTATFQYGDQVTLNLDDDGHLYLLNSTINIKNLTKEGYPQQRKLIYFMRLDVDGIFRVYSYSLDYGNQSTIWSSSTNKCSSLGLCGLNGFCFLMDQEAKCQCLPGFENASPGNWTAGCVRSFTSEGCKAMDANRAYEMRKEDNTVWEDDSYSVLTGITIQDCEQSCLEDCNCEAALFNDQNCKKQRLPVRYGRRSFPSSSSAFIKVGMSGSINKEDQVNKGYERTKKEIPLHILIIGISFLVFSCIVLAISGILVNKARIWRYKKIDERRNVELIDDISSRAFSYAGLVEITNNFKEELGRGAFGTVYKGILPDNQKEVAVKRLDKVLAEGEREFQNEMKVIGKTHHKNLIRLVGYCLDGPKRLLVYEFMSNGSLADILFTTGKQLIWEERIKIALDIARGILYLHQECETQIIHCDIKPQNILMDDSMCAKISDFGLAKLLKHDQTRTFTGVRGTRGYVAPEWHKNLPVTVKADVYSFGIVLFEILCGRKSVDWSLPEDEAILENWVYDCFEGGVLRKLIRRDEEKDVDWKKLERMVKVGIWCIQDEPSLRPSMMKVFLMLEGTVDIPIPPSPTSFLSAL